MPNLPHHHIDALEVNTRNRIASEVVSGFSAATPTLAEIWECVESALADTPILATEVIRLQTELASARLDRANLAAAARATIAAYRDGEQDPLSYLRDEIGAQGLSGEEHQS